MKAAIRTGWTGLTLSFSSNHPAPAPSTLESEQVIVNVKAAAINPVDYKIPFKMLGPVYGLDFSGTIESVGSSASSKFQIGDEVFGKCKGSLAEKSICNIKEICHKPDFLSFEEAAALPVAYLTGIQGLRDNGGIDLSAKSEDDEKSKSLSVLVIGASGGCGTAALQLMKGMNRSSPSPDLKVSRIVAICSKKNFDFVTENGATEVINYTNEDQLQSFFQENKGQFDCVYDCSTGSGGKADSYFEVSQPIVKPQTGRYVALNGSPQFWTKRFLGKLKDHQRLIMTSTNTADLSSVCDFLKIADAKPSLSVKPFTEDGVKEGFQLLKSRRAKGKIVFSVSS